MGLPFRNSSTTTTSSGRGNSPHYKSGGFWFTLGTFVVSGLVLTGVLSPDEENKMTAVTHHVIQSISLIGTVGASYWYGKNREKKLEKKEEEPDTKLPEKPKNERRKPRTRSTKPVRKTKKPTK